MRIHHTFHHARLASYIHGMQRASCVSSFVCHFPSICLSPGIVRLYSICPFLLPSPLKFVRREVFSSECMATIRAALTRSTASAPQPLVHQFIIIITASSPQYPKLVCTKRSTKTHPLYSPHIYRQNVCGLHPISCVCIVFVLGCLSSTGAE